MEEHRFVQDAVIGRRGEPQRHLLCTEVKAASRFNKNIFEEGVVSLAVWVEKLGIVQPEGIRFSVKRIGT